ncbi:MAG: OB-fold domain-containing protein [Pseudomonadota bacterium]
MSEQKPLHNGLFTWPDTHPELLGSRCRSCGEYAFPAQDSCRHCTSTDTEIVRLGRAGKLWTWTIQTFMPKTPYRTDETPETFTPYGVGYIELECGLRVESRLRENTTDQLAIGMPMELELIPVRKDDEGAELLTFQFCAKEAA